MTTTLESIAAEIGRIAGHKWQRPFRTKLCTLRMHLWLHAQEVARLREENKRMRLALDEIVADAQEQAEIAEAQARSGVSLAAAMAKVEMDRIVAEHATNK